MRFHPGKCNIMSVTRKHNPRFFKYSLNGIDLTRADSIEYLGVTITKNLNWGNHIQSVCNRGNKVLGLLRRNLSFCSKEVKLAAYKGLQGLCWSMLVLFGILIRRHLRIDLREYKGDLLGLLPTITPVKLVR